MKTSGEMYIKKMDNLHTPIWYMYKFIKLNIKLHENKTLGITNK